MLVDVSSVCWTALLAGKDKENGREVVFNGKKVWINSASYGLDNAVEFLAGRLNKLGLPPKSMILVVEGKSSKLLRTSMYEGYKAGREKPAESYTEFTSLRDQLVQTFLDLGAQAVTQDGIEADDVIGYLARELPACFVVSNDGDLQAIISETAHLINSAGEVDKNRYGPFPTRFTTVYKALVGDDTDKIKGARGFGPASFLDLYCIFGDEGLEALETLILARNLELLHEDVPSLKSLQRIIDDRENVYLSYDLAKLYVGNVNTLRKPLIWTAGMVKPAPELSHPELAQWYAKRKLVHAGNIDSTLSWFSQALQGAESVALDIETSAPDESDEWLARRAGDILDDGSYHAGSKVDVFGHELTGLSMTLGDNDQYTLYFAVDHTEADGVKNVTPAQVYDYVQAIPQEKPIIVQNASFELSVLHRTWGEEAADNGWHGFLPNVHDTAILSNYVDENQRRGLKDRSGQLLGYTQVTYEEVTKGRRMNQLAANEAFDYGCDDTICTAALYNHYVTICQIEKTFEVYKQVEILPAYLTSLAYNQGTDISLEEVLKQQREDKEAYEVSWLILQQYLISKGWEGTVCPRAEKVEDITAAFIKEAHLICTGREFETQVRTPKKLLAMLAAGGNEMFARSLNFALNDGDLNPLNNLIKLHFAGEPIFNIDSPVQNRRLMYDVMGLPVRLTNPPTDNMRAAGKYEGTPRSDALSVQFALLHDAPAGSETQLVLRAIQAMKEAHTREKMFYKPYLTVQHWKDGKVHASAKQCQAVTRRYAYADPNLQQLPKHAKATGIKPKFRRVFVPHHRRAVIVSKDFSGQELVIIADGSQDPNMLACYIGDDKKDMHSLTTTGILQKKALARRVDQLWAMSGREGTPTEDFVSQVVSWREIDYDGFVAMADTPDWGKLFDVLRALGKKTNFTTEYGAMAPKLAETLLVDASEAQQYIDAKLAAFPRAEAWKQELTQEAHKTGYGTTNMGARRHLRTAFLSGKGYEIGAAERQAVNFRVQGSAAEQTKLAMAGLWTSGIYFRLDARFIAPIHDEVVDSVGIDDLIPFLFESHAIMTRPYGGMNIPIVSSISFGKNFGEQIEVGETVDPARIRAALEKLFPDEPLTARWRQPYNCEQQLRRAA